MNAEQRAALVEELADAIYRGTLEGEGGIDDGHYQDEFYPYLDGFARSMANDVLPIIDRLLATHDIDAMLDAAGMKEPYIASNADVDGGVTNHGGPFYVRLYGDDGRAYSGKGETFVAAVRDACRKAMEGRDDE